MHVLRIFIFLPWLLMELAGAGWAQKAPSTRADSLVTAVQVQQFVRARTSVYSSYKSFTLPDSLGQECDSALGCLALGGRASWLKADFDGNGRMDLLVTGYPSSSSLRRRITCFLDLGEQNFKEVRLNSRVYDCAVFQPGRVKNGAAICYAHIVIDRSYGVARKAPACQVDTLIFDKTHFIEYNQTPRDYQIQRVAFSTTECYGTCPVFSLQMDHSGSATHQAGKHSKKQGTFAATIDAPARSELWSLLNYLNFPKLQDHYAISATDNPTYTLLITYADSKVKTIEDYGGEGTFGLRRIYELLFRLRTTQAWQKVGSLNSQ